jgi:hypothetical protein
MCGGCMHASEESWTYDRSVLRASHQFLASARSAGAGREREAIDDHGAPTTANASFDGWTHPSSPAFEPSIGPSLR